MTRLIAPAAVFLLAAFLLPSAWAHARLLRSNPAQKAQLAQSPKQVELWFNELLDGRLHKIGVFAAGELSAKDRKNHCKGEAKVDPKERTRVFAELPELAPGDYVVEYRVLSRDGHTAVGRIPFSVTAGK